MMMIMMVIERFKNQQSRICVVHFDSQQINVVLFKCSPILTFDYLSGNEVTLQITRK